MYTISEIVGKLSHMEEKIIPKSISTLHLCIFWGESKEKRFIIHGEGLLLWRTDLAPTELQSYT